MTACKNELEDFSCKIEPIIEKMNDASTIKLLPEVKKELNDMVKCLQKYGQLIGRDR